MGTELNPETLSQVVQFISWTGLAASLVLVVLVALLLRFISSTAGRLSAAFSARRLTIQKIESVTRFFIYALTVGIVTSLSFRVNETVLTLIGGTLAVAIGFAMRDLIAAVVAGVTIMFDRPFQVGDRVEYAGQYGDITQIGLRSVRMNTLDDNIVTIPNNRILTDVTSCGNWGALEMQQKMEFVIGLDQDVDKAMELIRDALVTSRFVFLEREVIVLVKQVIKENYVAVQLTGKAYVLDTKYEKAFETDVYRRVLRAFRDHSILPPAVLIRQTVAETE